MKHRILILALALAVPALTQAQETAPDVDPVVMSAGFLSHHPDIDFRAQGLKAFEDGFLNDAITYFTRAALHADKASQAMLAEMHWSGRGVAQDRALAYAWMDLAAERLYPTFLAVRERYWTALDESERARAVEVGLPLYAKYGDDAAKPRLESALRRGRQQTTGSRMGFVGFLTIQMAGPGGQPITLRGDEYYAKKYWQPEHYWEWTDEIWSAPPKGRVDVGELERTTTP